MPYPHVREDTRSDALVVHPALHKPSTNQPRVDTENGPENTAKSPVNAALWYAARGIPVFPLHAVDAAGRCSCDGSLRCKPGKHPRIRNGHHGATTDPGRIRRWWSRWPAANIGIPTGERSGLLALDVDAHGDASLADLQGEYGQLPETLTNRTGSGGMHVLFKYPPGCGVGNSAGKVGRGLDMRGEGGYVVAPPSRTDQGPYTILDKKPPAEPPAWLLQAARAPHRAFEIKNDRERPTISAALDGEPIQEGERNQALTRIGGSHRARGLEQEELEEELLAVNAARCSPPLEDSEVAGIARSVCRYPAGDASPEPDSETLEAVETLSTDVLEGRTWTGRKGPTKHALYAALLLLAQRHGRMVGGAGVKVYTSTRQLAELAGTTNTTVVERGIPGLIEDGLVYRASGGSGTKAGALVLRIPHRLTTQPHRGSTDSGQAVRDILRELLRLRWGAGRPGKLFALYLEVIARSGRATLSEICERTGRRRDNVRRSLDRPAARAMVECSEGTYILAPEFAAVFDNELEVSGIKAAERLQRARHARQREGYRAHVARRQLAASAQREPDGFIEDLQRVEPEGNPQPRLVAEETPRASEAYRSADAVIADASDSDQVRRLAALAREHVAAHRSKHLPAKIPASERAARLILRLRHEAPDMFDALRLNPRRLAWELWGRGWTESVCSGNTVRVALALVEGEHPESASSAWVA